MQALCTSRRFGHCRARIADADRRRSARLGERAPHDREDERGDRTRRRNIRARKRLSKERALVL